MGLVGEVRRRLASQYQAGVVFTHVPKCGGSSLEAALFRHYRFSRERIFPIEARQALRTIDGAPTAPFPGIEAFNFREQLVAYALHRGVKCVTGHNPLSPALRQAFTPDWKFITILREPVSRFCSGLRYAHRSGVETSINEDFDRFLETPRARWFGAYYVGYFGGWRDLDEKITQSAVDAARKMILDLDAVGFLDRLPEFQKDLRRLLGADIKIGHKNRTKDRATSWDGEFTDNQMEKIRALCRPDIEIYEYVRERKGGNASEA